MLSVHVLRLVRVTILRYYTKTTFLRLLRYEQFISSMIEMPNDFLVIITTDWTKEARFIGRKTKLNNIHHDSCTGYTLFKYGVVVLDHFKKYRSM